MFKMVEQKVQKLVLDTIIQTQFNTPKRIPQIRQSVGRIYVLWSDNIGQPIQKQVGTAFAITNSIILTCLHNVYSSTLTAYCSQVLFVPGVKKGSLENSKTYKSQKKHFLYCRQPQRDMSQKPQKQQLCLIMLQQQLPVNNFIQIQNIDLQGIRMDEKIGIVGYPGGNCQFELMRAQQYSSIHSIDEHILSYTIDTSAGQSGSPVFQQDKEGKMKIIGMHTHRGVLEQFNSGLCFNNEMIKILASLLRQIFDSYYQKQEIVSKARQIYNKLRWRDDGVKLLTSSISTDDPDDDNLSDKQTQSPINEKEQLISRQSFYQVYQETEGNQAYDRFYLENQSNLIDSQNQQGKQQQVKNQLLEKMKQIQNQQPRKQQEEITFIISDNRRRCVKQKTELTNANKLYDATERTHTINQQHAH